MRSNSHGTSVIKRQYLIHSIVLLLTANYDSVMSSLTERKLQLFLLPILVEGEKKVHDLSILNIHQSTNNDMDQCSEKPGYMDYNCS